MAYTIREALELLRDPIRLGFSLFGTALLMLVFGFGVSTDVNNLSFAVLDRDQTPESRAYLEELRGSAYFVEKAPIADYADLDSRLKSGDIKAAIEIPPGLRPRHQARASGLGRARWSTARCRSARRPSAAICRACTNCILRTRPIKTTAPAAPPPADIEIRFKYNQDFDSIYAMVPSNIAMLLALFPAILMALAIVREKELGSITNLYVTPGDAARIPDRQATSLHRASRWSNFTLLFLMALFVFHVPLKGSFPVLLLGVLIYVTTMTGLRHADFGVHQDADRGAVRHRDPDGAAGDPIRRHDDAGVLAGRRGADHGARHFPMTYFVPISVGTFTKGLGFARSRYRPAGARGVRAGPDRC